MANEDWENKKLVPILTDAYHLVIKIEGKKEEANKKIRQLQKAKEKLAAQHKKLEEFHSYDDKLANIGLIFKTIMCPYQERCPKDKRARWPKSGLTNVTRFGS